MTGSLLDRVKQSYKEAERLTGLPYVFSGGHNSQWKPSLSYATGIGAPGAGIDCSAGVSYVLRAGGFCWGPRAPLPLATGNFMEWGIEGVGKWLSLYCRNDSVEQHCGLRFSIGEPGFENTYWQAPHTGEDVGWLTLDITDMRAAHWPST